MLQKQFVEIIQLIKQARNRAIKSVNTELINLFTGILVNTSVRGLKMQNGGNL